MSFGNKRGKRDTMIFYGNFENKRGIARLNLEKKKRRCWEENVVILYFSLAKINAEDNFIFKLLNFIYSNSHLYYLT